MAWHGTQKEGVYIIAEMSANHGGKLERALQIVEEAAAAGADCVKIQTYTADTLTLDCSQESYRIKGGLWNGYTFYDLYQEASTPWEWHKPIQKKCQEMGVDFLSTPFDCTAVDFLEELGVEFYKIASPELVDIPLIKYVASKGKPVILSCGMGTEEEIGEALQACRDEHNYDITLLKCCSQYPAPYDEMNLAALTYLKEQFDVEIGLSDHSEGSLASVIAVALGAKVIEKHVCLSRSIKTPDSEFSMEMQEFAQMVQDVKNAVKILGEKQYELTEKEEEQRIGRRSLVASDVIHKGDIFTANNVKSIRPAIGIKPKYYGKILGKPAKQSYDFGEPISDAEL